MSDTQGLHPLYNLLSRASNVSCSKGANAFLSLLTTENDSLSFAIDGLIPALQNQSLQIPQRILAAFVLNALYVSHDHLNPFHDHLLQTFESERAIAIAASRMKSPYVGPSQRVPQSPQDRNGIQSENEQFVWVLWKILQGEGSDLAPYSPNLLSRTTIPEHLRPLHLNMHGGSGHGNGTRFNSRHSSTELSRSGLGFIAPLTSQNSTILFETKNPSSLSGTSRTPSAPRPYSNRVPSSSEFSPFDVTSPESSGVYHQKSPDEETQMDGSLQQTVSKESSSRHFRYQHSALGAPYGYAGSPAFLDPMQSKAQADIGSIPQIPHNQHSKVIGDQRQETLLRGLIQDSYAQNNPDSLLGGIAGIYNRPDMNNQTNTNTKMLNESSRVEEQLQQSTSVLHRASTQSDVQQRPVQNFIRNHNITSENASSLSSVAFDTRSNTRSRLDPILRPHPRTPSSQSAALYSPATPSAFETFSVDRLVSRPGVTSYNHELPHESLMQMNNTMPQAPGIPFSQQKRTQTPTRVSPPARSPGVIGSGRPSGPISKNDTSVDHNTLTSRWSQIGIIGNGRPESFVPVGDLSLANRGTDARRKNESMIPFSVLRMRSMKEESEKREHGITARPETELGDDNGRQSEAQLDEQTGLIEKLTALNFERRAQKSSQEADIGSFRPATRAFDRNWSPSQDKTDSAANQNIKNDPVIVSPQHPGSALPSMSHADHEELSQLPEIPQPSPVYISKRDETSEGHINEKERDELSYAIFLLLSARERVLTLTEQRMLQPHLSTLTQPLSLLRPSDIPALVAKNTDIAARLLLFLLDRNDEDAERIERAVRDASKSSLFRMNLWPSNDSLSLPAAATIDSTAAVDTIQAMARFVSTCGAPSNAVDSNDISLFGGREAKEGYLDAIRRLPPTMQSFNLVAKLLRPTHPGGATSEKQEESPEVRVANLIRTEVLGGFVSECVRWIENAEQEEREGELLDDRVAVAIASLCRFYSSLLKHGFVSAASEADTIEMMRFALQFSRFEEARSLYSTLAAART